MLHRAATVLIIVFWLTMTGLLVRNEFAPEKSGVREVPVATVLRLLFLSDRGSDLNITSDGTLVGRLNLRPHVDSQTGTKTLTFGSTIQVRAGGNPRQHINLDGEMQLDRMMTVQRFEVALLLSDPAGLKTEVTIEPGANRAHVALNSQAKPKAPWQIIEEHDYTLDEAGARELLAQTGLDPALLTKGKTPQFSPKVHARLSSIVLRGERVETYLLVIEQNGQTLAEMHVDLLGNVLQAKTILGYNFAPDIVTP